MALLGALAGGVPGLLWWYLTDEDKSNFISQVVVPTLIGGGVGAGIGEYNFFRRLKRNYGR